MELEKQLQQINEAFAEFKKANDKEVEALKKGQTVSAEVKAKSEEMQNTIETLQAEMKKVTAALNRTNQNPYEGMEVDAKTAAMKKEYKEAFVGFMRDGSDNRSKEVKFMSSDSSVNGGFLVPDETSSEIIKQIFETSDVRPFASQQSISTNHLEMLNDLDEAGGGWVGEVETRNGDTDTPELGMLDFPVHELHAEPIATQNLLDDAAVNLEAWLSGKVSEKMTRLENSAFVVGNGVKKPKGVLSYAAGTNLSAQQIEQVVSGHASQITADGLINLVYQLKSAYAKNGQFFMNRLVEREVRKLKDSQNRYLWAPGLDGKSAGTLLGYAINQWQDMPVVGANALAIVFGDMKQAYQIIDRVGIRVTRDALTKKGFVKFYTTKRVGGGVKNFEAIKIQKISA